MISLLLKHCCKQQESLYGKVENKSTIHVVSDGGDANTFKPTRKRDKKETIISDVLVEVIFVIGEIDYFPKLPRPCLQKKISK